ncbi:hypothetical protein B0J12DRAFT_703266 [Macrophomina phaseolina]|uniref:Uncharacterized protein n=1 Tax=Macrophomina phaseolina TaxID=35725 RepID=A0ABQ8FZ08_9PEZI|nr:hypothetical protein B0J12DRAFT_703266 [Macrophomina phaseolina]
MSPPGDIPEIVPQNENVDVPTSCDISYNAESVPKPNMIAQTNGLSLKGPSGAVSSTTRSSGLFFISYTAEHKPGNQEHQQNNLPSHDPPASASPTTAAATNNDDHMAHHHRSDSAQTSPLSNTSTRLGTPHSTTSSAAFSTLRTGARTPAAAVSPFPVLTPADTLPSATIYTPRCPTCGSSRRYGAIPDPLNTGTSGIPSSRLTPLRPAPPPPPPPTSAGAVAGAGASASAAAGTPGLGTGGGANSHRHRANAVVSTPGPFYPPFRLQPPPQRGRRAGVRPLLLRTRTSPREGHGGVVGERVVSAVEAGGLKVVGEQGVVHGRRRSQSDVRHDRSRSPNTAAGVGSPPRTPRLRPSVVGGGEGVDRRRRDWREWDEFEELLERLRDAYKGEDQGGRKVIRGMLEGMMEGKRGELGAGGTSVLGKIV